MTSQNKRLSLILSAATLLLAMPAQAMQFSDEVHWTTTDFAIAGILLFGTGIACELLLRELKKPIHRLAVCGAVLAGLALIWIELAVGIFGTPWAGS